MSSKQITLDLDLSVIPTTFWRPDSIAILKDKDAILRFNRYWRILTRKTIAKFLICKKIEVSSYDTKNEEQMWEIHDQAMNKFHEILNKMNDEELLKWYKKQQRPANNLLKLKRDLAWKIVEKCRFCERKCNVDRTKGQLGVCRLSEKARISSIFIHVGEEPELVPSYTIFFSRCNFHCVYCQNWDISQRTTGTYLPPIEVAIMIEKHWNQNEIRNTNWVGGDPTPNIHYIFDILVNLEASIPQIWNSNFYNSIEALKLLDGVIDLWLPDFKYGNNKCGERLSKVPKYFEVVTRNFKIVNKKGDEILIRHLVLPNHLECCTFPILEWIKKNLDLSKVRVNIMAQYRPEYQAHKYADISRRLTREEYLRAIKYAKQLGIPLTT